MGLLHYNMIRLQTIIDDIEGEKIVALAHKEGRSTSNLLRMWITNKLKQIESDAE